MTSICVKLTEKMRKEKTKQKWCHNDAITKPIFMKFWYNQMKSTFNTSAQFYWNLTNSNWDISKQGIAKRTDSTKIALLTYFPSVFILWLKIKVWHKLSYVCPIIMNFSEDWGVGIIYLPTKFQLHWFISNGDLL